MSRKLTMAKNTNLASIRRDEDLFAMGLMNLALPYPTTRYLWAYAVYRQKERAEKLPPLGQQKGTLQDLRISHPKTDPFRQMLPINPTNRDEDAATNAGGHPWEALDLKC